MTRAITVSLATGLWHLGALGELPRDLHCSHDTPPNDAAARAVIAQCPECRRVLEVLEALRNERPS